MYNLTWSLEWNVPLISFYTGMKGSYDDYVSPILKDSESSNSKSEKFLLY